MPNQQFHFKKLLFLYTIRLSKDARKHLNIYIVTYQGT